MPRLHLNHSHPWSPSTSDATTIQESLRAHVRLEDDLGNVTTVGGADVGFEDEGSTVRAAVVVLDAHSLVLTESAIVRHPCTFPYVPGFLSFREIPGILKALEQLAALPDLILCDGQGTAHPRGMGLACHLGVLTDIPCIGVAKSRLVGTYTDLPPEKGAHVPLSYKGKVVGAVLRSRTNVNPLFVSPGHRVALPTAIEWVMRCLTRYRLPETTRHAHHLASGK